MELEYVTIDAHNMMAIVTDPQVYVIKKEHPWETVTIRPIKYVAVDDILSGENLVVRITTK